MANANVLISVGELCRRAEVPYRDVRYVLERGILPNGVDPNPDRGNHRLLTGGQAFWLAMVLRLKQQGIRAPVARQITEFAKDAIRGIAGNASFDPRFHPFLGQF